MTNVRRIARVARIRVFSEMPRMVEDMVVERDVIVDVVGMV